MIHFSILSNISKKVEITIPRVIWLNLDLSTSSKMTVNILNCSCKISTILNHLIQEIDNRAFFLAFFKFDNFDFELHMKKCNMFVSHFRCAALGVIALAVFGSAYVPAALLLTTQHNT